MGRQGRRRMFSMNSCIQENHCIRENSCIQENSCRARKASVLYHISTAQSNELNISKELSERTLNVPNTRIIKIDVWGNRGIHHSDVTIRNHYAWIKMLHCSPKICKIMRQKLKCVLKRGKYTLQKEDGLRPSKNLRQNTDQGASGRQRNLAALTVECCLNTQLCTYQLVGMSLPKAKHLTVQALLNCYIPFWGKRRARKTWRLMKFWRLRKFEKSLKPSPLSLCKQETLSGEGKHLFSKASCSWTGSLRDAA